MENILVLDSGIGGLYTAKILKEKFTNFNYIYFKDSFNCPYGNKSKEELFVLAKQNINFVLKRYKIKAVVIACNTLSTNCYKQLKTAYNLPFFVVKPPISKINKNTLILCTKTCYKALKIGLKGKEQGFDEITVFKTMLNKSQVIICAMHNLAFLIEKNVKNKAFLFRYLEKILNPILNKKYNQIILGCTHYNFVKNELAHIFKNPEFLEGSDFINLTKLKQYKNSLLL